MNSDGELREAGKRRCEEEEDTIITSATDSRLSHLPEPIICHILSFLDTKFAVRTSVLSRDWIHAWKHVPVLNLQKKSFHEDYLDQFGEFVSKVLSLRYDLKLQKLVYVDRNYRGSKKATERFAEVVNYALAHNVQHLVLEMSVYDYPFCDFGSIFSEFYDNNNNDNDNNEKNRKEDRNLTTLDLTWITLGRGFVAGCSGFPMLTTLNVENCELDADHQGLLLSADYFPCLKNLAMTDCFPKTGPRGAGRIKVYGPYLLSLKLRGMGYHEIEIYAPELKFLGLCQYAESKGFFDSALPALDHADISFKTGINLSHLDKTKAEHYLNSLFHCLRSAKTLKLDGSTIQIMKVMCEILEQQPSPFERLESLIVASNNLRDKVIDYFFKASSREKLNIIVRSLT